MFFGVYQASDCFQQGIGPLRGRQVGHQRIARIFVLFGRRLVGLDEDHRNAPIRELHRVNDELGDYQVDISPVDALTQLFNREKQSLKSILIKEELHILNPTQIVVDYQDQRST